MKLEKFLILFAIIMVFINCKNNSDFSLNEKISLSFYTYGDPNDPSYIAEETIYKDFQKENPYIELKIERLFGDPFSYKLEAYALTNRIPDVVFMWPGGKTSILHTRKLMKDLYPFIKNIKDQFLPSAIEPQLSGYLSELPNGITISHVLYVNNELLKRLNLKIPNSYDELKRTSSILKSYGYGTILMPNKETWVLQSCLFSTIAGRLAGDDFFDKITKKEAKFTDTPFVDSLKFLKQIFLDGVISKKSFEISYNEAPVLFSKGQYAFYIDGDWRTSAFITNYNNESEISIEKQKLISMTIFPSITNEINQKTASGAVSVGYGISNNIKSGSDKEKAAWKFVSYLQSPDVQKKRLEKSGTFPSRKNITVENLEPIVKERGSFYPKVDKMTYILDSIFDSKVAAQINLSMQELILDVKSPEEAAEDIQKIYEESTN